MSAQQRRKTIKRILAKKQPWLSPSEDSRPRIGKALANHGWNYDWDVGKSEKGGWVPPGTKTGPKAPNAPGPLAPPTSLSRRKRRRAF